MTTTSTPPSPGESGAALRVLVADDEPLARKRLRQLIQREPDLRLIAECADGPETLRGIRELRPDLVLVDVAMPGLDGLEVMRLARNMAAPAFIVVTALEDHAIRAFEMEAVDYLLKPFERGRFQEALRRVREKIKLPADPARLAQDIETALHHLKDDRPPGVKFRVADNNRIHFVEAGKIDFVEAAGNYVKLHTDGSTHLLRLTLGIVEQMLRDTGFVRISRSILVNEERILELHRCSHGDYRVLLRNGTELKGTRAFRPQLARLLN